MTSGKCTHCGGDYTPKSTVQKYCIRPECARERNILSVRRSKAGVRLGRESQPKGAQMWLRLRQQQFDALAHMAQSGGVSKTELVREAVDMFLHARGVRL